MSKDLDNESMKLLAELLTSVMPDGWGFTLVTFQTNVAPADVLYISNANREDMKGTMESLINKWNRLEEFKNPNLN